MKTLIWTAILAFAWIPAASAQQVGATVDADTGGDVPTLAATTDLRLLSYVQATPDTINLEFSVPDGGIQPTHVELRFAAFPLSDDLWEDPGVSRAFLVKLSAVPSFSFNKRLTWKLSMEKDLPDGSKSYLATRNLVFSDSSADPVDQSGVSNSIWHTTVDSTEPAPTNPLVITALDAATLRVAWQEAGDDDRTGVLAGFELYRSTLDPVVAGGVDGWALQATLVDTSGVIPQGPGSNASIDVGGLSPSTLYYFALRSVDDAGNLSRFSPAFSGTTLSAGSSPAVQAGEEEDGNAPACGNSATATAALALLLTVVLASIVNRQS